MDPGVEVLIRKGYDSDRKDLYYLTLFTKLEDMNELFMHPDIIDIIGKNVVRLEKIDNYRFKLFVSK
ncbi:hypothetical protein ACFQ21_17750 [Ohtaekwangia kribbensis]|jgi:hypothetical protein|uniref:Uncharacterized protein n=1 Tax=Ohtaekwangia kribbensis TaxID=688913 RepID=A0ABW3K4I6_9BACT